MPKYFFMVGKNKMTFQILLIKNLEFLNKVVGDAASTMCSIL